MINPVLQNYTVFVPKITNECINWCREAHFSHASNLEVQGLFLIVLAFIALAARTILKDTEYFYKIDGKLIEAAKWLMLGYLLYWWLNSRGLI